MHDFDLKKWNKNTIVIYGIGHDGIVIAMGLQKNGIDNFIFCDKSIEGTQNSFQGKKVISPKYLVKYPEANILIASGKYCVEIYNDIIKLQLNNINIFYARSLYFNGDENVQSHSCKMVYNRFGYAAAIERLLAEVDGGWYWPILYILTTEKCTLRCANCFNLMPCYASPKNCSLTMTIEAMNRLLQSGCHIGIVCLTGGEPFINQLFMLEFLQVYKEETRIGCFQTITNGTLLPSDELAEAMGDTGRMYAIFSNYESLSKQMERAVDKLQSYGVGTAVEEEEDITSENGTLWIDYGEVKRYGYAPEQAQQMFDACVNATGCTTLLNGKLYICGHIANGVNAGMIPEGERLCIDLTDNSARGVSSADVKNWCLQLLKDRVYSPGCEYCGRALGKLAVRAKQL